ncbi:MAG: hypothetical protein U9R69_08220, partial [Thermodesulfobacteriota bacterium]|nr:hypothetical protein [Thermodesulfobacteriota bacterium]
GLIFLATPMLAAAEGRHNDHGHNHHRGWVKNDQHNNRDHYGRHDQRRNYRYDNRRNHCYQQKRNHHAKKHLRRELRESRQELRQLKRQIRHHHRQRYYVRPSHSNSAVIFGLPHLVFQFDW